MKHLWLFLAVFALALPAESSDAIRKESVAVQGSARTYYLFVPDGLSTAKPAPLIVLLHGSGRNGLSLVEKWTDLAQRERALIAGLDAKDHDHWYHDLAPKVNGAAWEFLKGYRLSSRDTRSTGSASRRRAWWLSGIS